jgi:predicted metal-dependent hydrolase
MFDDCNQPLSDEALNGIVTFNAGEYYAQHDIFEALWANTDAPIRILYKAILQVGVGYYQIQQGNLRGAIKMLRRADKWLAQLPDVCSGVDVRQLRHDAKQVHDALMQNGLDHFDMRLLTRVKLVAE